jgi:hypothetical protein
LLPSKVTMTIARGTVFRHEVAGAGGWGDPLERDPAAVLKDVRNELVSLTAARDLYGVIINASTWTVEAERTQQLRADLRAARGWTEIPVVLWEEPPRRAADRRIARACDRVIEPLSQACQERLPCSAPRAPIPLGRAWRADSRGAGTSSARGG